MASDTNTERKTPPSAGLKPELTSPPIEINGWAVPAEVRVHAEPCEPRKDARGAQGSRSRTPWELVFEVAIGGSALLLRDNYPHLRTESEWRDLGLREGGLYLGLAGGGNTCVDTAPWKETKGLTVWLPRETVAAALGRAIDEAVRLKLPFIHRD